MLLIITSISLNDVYEFVQPMTPKESAVAKSTGYQDEYAASEQDSALFRVLSSKRKISKNDANYINHTKDYANKDESKCSKCKFNLGDERECLVVEGEIDNDHGISRFFSPKGVGMLPGDIVWDFIKKTGRKLNYDEGYVINEGAEGFQCRDCKYYTYSHKCLLIKGLFAPQMSCGYIVKNGNGTDI